MSGAILGIDPSRRTTSAEFRLGSIGGYDHPTYGYQEYVYGKAGSDIPVGGAAVNLPNGTVANGEWTALTTTNAAQGTGGGLPVAFAQGAAFADDEYGWLLQKGTGGVLTYASAAVGTRLYTTATAGYLEDVSTSTLSVVGVALTIATGGASAVNTSARVLYPYVGISNVV